MGGKLIDLTGKRFGRLTVLERAAKRKDGVRWLCQCDCGEQKEVSGNSLRKGKVRSCGCLQRETASGWYSDMPGILDRRRKETIARYEKMIGKRFDRLVVKQVISQEKEVMFECVCDCENIVVIPALRVVRKEIRSCGCLRTEPLIAMSRKPRADVVEGTRLGSIGPARKMNSNNKSGIRGVHQYGKKWAASIMIKGACIHLGLFDTIEEAAEARRRGEDELFKPILEKYGWGTEE